MRKQSTWIYLTIALLSVALGFVFTVTASAQTAAGAATVVSFDGTNFAPSIVSIDNGWEIEVRNNTNQNLSLTVSSGAPVQTQTPRVYLPLLSTTGAEAQAAAPAGDQATTVAFPAQGAIRLTMDGDGGWTVAVAGMNNVTLAVYVVDMATPTPTPTPTPSPTPNQQEWKLHKSGDGAHPDGSEQQMVWLMNHARANPKQEGVWLATTNDPDIAPARAYFGVDVNKLQNEFNGYAAKPPAAFDVRLYNAARVHSEGLIARDAQDHDGQFEEVDAAGFDCAGGRGNVFAYADSAMNAHGAFNIDWGGNDGGMQSGRGHRKAIMSLDGSYTNVGIAMVAENSQSTDVGPMVTTGNYCHAGSGSDHFNRFVVGTVWNDKDGDAIYDPGEGIGGVRVSPDRGTYFAITGAAGGYAFPVTETGDYTVHFDVNGGVDRKVTVGSDSVLLDLLPQSAAAAAVEAVPAPAGAGTPRIPAPPAYLPPDTQPAP